MAHPSPLSAQVPQRRLRDGSTIPGIGMGTFGSDRYGPAEVSAAVAGALRVGYRLIDCAAVYGNEDSIGEVLADAFAGGLPRDEVYVMSKVWNDSHAPVETVASVERSLRDLRLDHLDAVFVHWPFPNHHAPHAGTDARDPHARPYSHDAYMQTWGALEGLVERGLVRHLGSSNTTIPKLRLLLRDAHVLPSLNEMELHPTFQQGELFQVCLENHVQPVGYSPLGSPSRPERDRTPDDVVDTEHPAIQDAARRLGVHPALVCLKWAVARGQIPIPFAVKPEQYTANLHAVTEGPLLPAELEAIRSAERNSRLIKGQVFLWEGASSWLDLWDVDGTIPAWPERATT
ncbi:aldo/keto reductase [Kineococcus gynurae]|uniref:Aldo/keto reductase n=1 Tax=Kineococcus gynurae TaxID=452979 RepID=A0ABV5LSW2_9ACTN